MSTPKRILILTLPWTYKLKYFLDILILLLNDIPSTPLLGDPRARILTFCMQGCWTQHGPLEWALLPLGKGYTRC